MERLNVGFTVNRRSEKTIVHEPPDQLLTSESLEDTLDKSTLLNDVERIASSAVNVLLIVSDHLSKFSVCGILISTTFGANRISVAMKTDLDDAFKLYSTFVNGKNVKVSATIGELDVVRDGLGPEFTISDVDYARKLVNLKFEITMNDRYCDDEAEFRQVHGQHPDQGSSEEA